MKKLVRIVKDSLRAHEFRKSHVISQDLIDYLDTFGNSYSQFTEVAVSHTLNHSHLIYLLQRDKITDF